MNFSNTSINHINPKTLTAFIIFTLIIISMENKLLTWTSKNIYILSINTIIGEKRTLSKQYK